MSTEYLGDELEWCRIHPDGWIEQGGFNNPTAGRDWVITLLKPYKDDGYTLLSDTLNMGSRETGSAVTTRVSNKTDASFSIRVEDSNSGGASHRAYSWYACGY